METKRHLDVPLEEFLSEEYVWDGIIYVRSYVNASSGTEYHFTIDTREKALSVFCDDSRLSKSKEHYKLLDDICSAFGLPADQSGFTLRLPSDISKQSVVNAIREIYHRYNLKQDRPITVDCEKH